jgi:hypothetical protein
MPRAVFINMRPLTRLPLVARRARNQHQPSAQEHRPRPREPANSRSTRSSSGKGKVHGACTQSKRPPPAFTQTLRCRQPSENQDSRTTGIGRQGPE